MNKPRLPLNTRTTEFLSTKEYRRFTEFSDACRRDRYIGLCYGPPGVGKTLAARQYARWNLVEEHLLGYEYPPDPQLASCHSVHYTPPVSNSPRHLAKEIDGLHFRWNRLVDHARYAQGQAPDSDTDYCELLIVDEADRLKMQGVEQLRDVYDRGACGLILMGMPGLEKRLSRYPQLYSRVGFAHEFRTVSAEDMPGILAHHWERLGCPLEPTDVADKEALTALVRITGGNFRLIHRLFAQIGRILPLNDYTRISKEVVEAARECLVIGTT